MFVVLFLLLLLAIATGPIGFAILLMVGIPVVIVAGSEMLAHSSTKPR
jgi:hypothetical protein